MAGVWNIATFAAFLAEALMRGTAIRLRDGAPSGLFDARDFPVQPAAVAKAIEAAVVQANRISTAPCAIVGASALALFQAKRLLAADHCRFFLDYDEALAWLTMERARIVEARSPLGN